VNFRVTGVETYVSPDNLNVDSILARYETSCSEIENVLKSHTFHQYTNQAFEIALHEQLGELFTSFFWEKGITIYSGGYSPRINFMPDVAIGSPIDDKRIYIEIEFGHNEFEDIVKFQIGYKNHLELGVLMVAKNGEVINRRHTMMPNFKKCRDILVALEPDCPILLIGFDGKWD